MKANKTQPTKHSVEEFLRSVEDAQRQADSRQLVLLMQFITGKHPVMWGDSIIGFGSYHYTHASGREGDTAAVGFSPRKNALVLYGLIYEDQNLDLLENLGKYRLGKGCLYIDSLDDVDQEVLRKIIALAYKHYTIPR